ncbi:unnamed protein product (macronuclear) [Paramecium tetraurelia]|uniref:Uncharacterized protein n=1 Tax=Paramecium tetraurelia TaxID=5888 RepID=A0E3L8_PARTE|nr:uncharacterized protein GSPATT00023058001 [Paramecium tetraurelia]CAK89885.1 unnamed protein product [Paramecium tetraurelia]|eukprot:XP_001457282.1 hypothetical protein (macronuclear) [Paramecium tetraurelia strain d4-2]
MSQPSETKQSIQSGRMVLHPSLKLDKSAAFFKNTRVSSCSYVRMKQGNPEAVPFYEIANKTPAEHETKSTYTTSSYADDYKVRPNLHVGSTNKLLEPYNTGSFRSRLPEPDAPILTKNASQIELGDRHFNVKRHFLSTAHNVYGNFGKPGNITNPGILSEKTKWHHHLQQK